jgi:hypothetical protein
MEIVWLWLDDLDDVAFCCARCWAPLRRLCLQTGLGASLALAAAELGSFAEWSNALAAVAAASVAVWIAGALCAAGVWLRVARRSAAA